MTTDFFPNSNLLITGGPDEEDEEHEERVFVKVCVLPVLGSPRNISIRQGAY
jgi:hypothetical protein